MSSAVFVIEDPAGGAFRAVPYSEKKVDMGIAGLMHFQNFGALQDKAEISKEEFQSYLQSYSSRNSRVKKPVFHASCSSKGTEFTHEELKDIALEIMTELGYSETPLLIYGHNDTENNHVHVVTSRIGLDGKKINDTFERKRANALLNKILARNPSNEFALNFDNFSKYSFSTKAQFFLLFENLGYKVKEVEGNALFYKHGKLLGKKDIATITSLINTENTVNTKRYYAIINKYKKSFDSTLRSNKEDKYTSEALKLNSQLTINLKNVFGWEFIFFTKKGSDDPYGYVLIDHKEKRVMKGSAIMNLGMLIDNKTFAPSEKTTTTKASKDNNDEVNNFDYPGSLNNIPEASERINDLQLNIFDLLEADFYMSPDHKRIGSEDDDEDDLKRKRRRKFSKR